MNLTVNVATTSLTLPTGLSVAGIRVTITDAQGAAVTDTNGSAIAPVVLTSPPGRHAVPRLVRQRARR